MTRPDDCFWRSRRRALVALKRPRRTRAVPRRQGRALEGRRPRPLPRRPSASAGSDHPHRHVRHRRRRRARRHALPAARGAADSEAPAEAASVPPTPSGAAPRGPTEERRRTRASRSRDRRRPRRPLRAGGGGGGGGRRLAEQEEEEAVVRRRGGWGRSRRVERPSKAKPAVLLCCQKPRRGRPKEGREPFGHAGPHDAPRRDVGEQEGREARHARQRQGVQGTRELAARGLGEGGFGMGRGSDPSAAE